jgi:hypothetical protein
MSGPDDESELRAVFASTGYSYPGTAKAALRLLTDEVIRLRDVREWEQRKYAQLLSDVRQATVRAPSFGNGVVAEDPVAEVRRMAEHLRDLHDDETSHAGVFDVITRLRVRFPDASLEHGRADEFLEAIAKGAEGDLVTPLVNASVAYWRALINHDGTADPNAVPLAAARWNRAVEAYLDDDTDVGIGKLR